MRCLFVFGCSYLCTCEMILINDSTEVIFTGMPVLWHGNLLKLGSFIFCFRKHKLNDYMAMRWAADLAALCWKLITFDNLFWLYTKRLSTLGWLFWNNSQINSDLIHLAGCISWERQGQGRNRWPRWCLHFNPVILETQWMTHFWHSHSKLWKRRYIFCISFRNIFSGLWSQFVKVRN